MRFPFVDPPRARSSFATGVHRVSRVVALFYLINQIHRLITTSDVRLTPGLKVVEHSRASILSRLLFSAHHYRSSVLRTMLM